MATTEQLPPAPGLPGDGRRTERTRVRAQACRTIRFAFIDLREQRIDAELFRTIPADLMFRYNFVPLELQNNVLAIAAADPGQVQMSDELPLLLGKKLLIRVATARQIRRHSEAHRAVAARSSSKPPRPSPFRLPRRKKKAKRRFPGPLDARQHRQPSGTPGGDNYLSPPSSGAPVTFTSKRGLRSCGQIPH